MYTANPKMVKQAKAIPHISYEEAMELSHFGAKVLIPTYNTTCTYQKEYLLSLKILLTLMKQGTLITKI